MNPMLMDEREAGPAYRLVSDGVEYETQPSGAADLKAVFGTDFGMHIVSESSAGLTAGIEKIQQCRGVRKDGKRCTQWQYGEYCHSHRVQDMTASGALGDFLPGEVQEEGGFTDGPAGEDSDGAIVDEDDRYRDGLVYAAVRSVGSFHDGLGDVKIFVPKRTRRPKVEAKPCEQEAAKPVVRTKPQRFQPSRREQNARRVAANRGEQYRAIAPKADGRTNGHGPEAPLQLVPLELVVH